MAGDRSDADLLAAMAAGDEQAFRLFYRRYVRAALGLATRVLVDAALAEDAVQEAFVAAWRQADRFDPNVGRASTWLLTFVHRRAVDIARSRARRPSVPFRSEHDEACADDAALASVYERAWLEEAFARLPAAERDVLELAYVEGLTQREISQLRELPEGTVKSRTFSGLARLRLATIQPT